MVTAHPIFLLLHYYHTVDILFTYRQLPRIWRTVSAVISKIPLMRRYASICTNIPLDSLGMVKEEYKALGDLKPERVYV